MLIATEIYWKLRKNMVQILDSTLREGEQTPGVYFSPEKKMVIAKFLDRIGVDIIEAGNPAVDDEIALGIKRISQAGLKAKIGAHSLCKIDNVSQALDCGIDFLGVFFSVSEQRLQHDYNINLDVAIEKIIEVVSFAKEQNIFSYFKSRLRHHKHHMFGCCHCHCYCFCNFY